MIFSDFFVFTHKWFIINVIFWGKKLRLACNLEIIMLYVMQDILHFLLTDWAGAPLAIWLSGGVLFALCLFLATVLFGGRIRVMWDGKKLVIEANQATGQARKPHMAARSAKSALLEAEIRHPNSCEPVMADQRAGAGF
jgi:hypothetical protein